MGVKRVCYACTSNGIGVFQRSDAAVHKRIIRAMLILLVSWELQSIFEDLGIGSKDELHA